MAHTRGRLETEGKRKSLCCCRIPGKSAGVPGNEVWSWGWKKRKKPGTREVVLQFDFISDT